MTTLTDLLATLPQRGAVRWIGVRPARRVPVTAVDEAEVNVGRGLVGDRFAGSSSSARQVTLIQAEHLDVVARLLGRDHLNPALVRRNVVVAGINLLALNGATFRVGTALLEGSGACHPCSRMEEALGPGGFNAMRGHGGITARVIEPGLIGVGDEVALIRAGGLASHER
ncbi:MAG: MOSC domain-containing protein [Steroidobacteraceae bacterium]